MEIFVFISFPAAELGHSDKMKLGETGPFEFSLRRQGRRGGRSLKLLPPFNTVPYVVLTPNEKIVPTAAS